MSHRLLRWHDDKCVAIITMKRQLLIFASAVVMMLLSCAGRTNQGPIRMDGVS
jgi:hypothetical protein